MTPVSARRNEGFTSGSSPVGVDINLKCADYDGITFLDSTITGSNGTGLFVKARNDAPSYNTNPASLDGSRAWD